MSELMTEVKEQARASLRHLLERVNLHEDVDLLTKEEIIDTILTFDSDAKVSDLIETLTKKANDIREEQEKLRGLVETMAMEGPNQFNTVYYKPTCKFGWDDCIYDPAYIYSTYPDWYQSLYGDMTPEEAASKFKKSCCFNCTNGDLYDDEDK